MPLLPLEEQRECVDKWKQIGLGVMGIADMLIKLGLTYGSPKSLKLCKEIAADMAANALLESSQIAKDKGKFPEFNLKHVLESEYLRRAADDDAMDSIRKFGLRNSQVLTIAPTGTLSTMLQISGGIEPIFANSYTRTTKTLHDGDYVYKVYTPIVENYMKQFGITEENLPKYFVTAQDIDFHDRIKMQATWQQYIDASISSTVNLPNSATVEEVADLYIEAWRNGLKGITVFRDGCERAAILNTSTEEEEPEEEFEVLKRGEVMEVPTDITYRKYKLSTGCGKLYFFVGYDEDTGVIYDCFTNTDGTGGCTINTQAVSRLLSACIRGGVPVEYVIEQLQKAGTCPSFQYARGKGKTLSKGSSCASAIGHVLKEIMAEFKTADQVDESVPCQDNTKPPVSNKGAQICPDCGEKLVAEGGCIVCKACGWSKCG